MTDFIQRNRQEYIVNNGVYGNKNTKEVYIEGNKQKVELDRRLDEISIQSNLIVSGNSINRNVLDSSASSRTNINYLVDSDIYSDDDKEENRKQTESIYIQGANRAKEILERFHCNNQNK